METTLAITQDQLINSLSFKLPQTANYIKSRDDVTFFPANGNEFSPQGVKVIRFMLTGTQWLDPKSVRVQFKLSNRDPTNNLYLVNALPQNFIRRVRILCGGTLVEDVVFFPRAAGEGFPFFSPSGVWG